MARFCVSRATLTRHSCRETRHPGASDASVSGVTLHKTNPSDPTRTSMRHRSDAKRTHATAARKPSTPRHEIRNEPEPAKRRAQTGRWLGTGPRCRSAARSRQASAREGRRPYRNRTNPRNVVRTMACGSDSAWCILDYVRCLPLSGSTGPRDIAAGSPPDDADRRPKMPAPSPGVKGAREPVRPAFQMPVRGRR